MLPVCARRPMVVPGARPASSSSNLEAEQRLDDVFHDDDAAELVVRVDGDGEMMPLLQHAIEEAWQRRIIAHDQQLAAQLGERAVVLVSCGRLQDVVLQREAGEAPGGAGRPVEGNCVSTGHPSSARARR
jgi:hypothetical protein